MNISEEWWQFLLSGLIASVVGGGIAAFVATIVLRRTNYHQSNLALAAMTEQRRLADLETKRQDLRALTQLRELRNEASKEREISAIVDVMVLLGQGIQLVYRNDADSVEVDLELYTKIGVAVSRWGLETPKGSLSSDLNNWPGQWRDSLKKVRKKNNSAPLRKAAVSEFFKVTKAMLDLARKWHAETEENRERMLIAVKALRTESNGAENA